MSLELATALAARTTRFQPHFVLSDTPYQHEAARVGDQLLSRLRDPVTA